MCPLWGLVVQTMNILVKRKHFAPRNWDIMQMVIMVTFCLLLWLIFVVITSTSLLALWFCLCQNIPAPYEYDTPMTLVTEKPFKAAWIWRLGIKVIALSHRCHHFLSCDRSVNNLEDSLVPSCYKVQLSANAVNNHQKEMLHASDTTWLLGK